MLERPSLADIVIDTSALMAVLLAEPLARYVQAALLAAQGPIISAGNVTELLMVAAGQNPSDGERGARDVLDQVAPSIIPVDGTIAEAAHKAWRRFGKGNHPARLNYGDCFAYATAEHWELPLLCVGDDFAQTDIELVPLGPTPP